MLLRAMMAAPARTQTEMVGAADLPAVPGVLPVPKPKKVPEGTRRPAFWSKRKKTYKPVGRKPTALVAPATP